MTNDKIRMTKECNNDECPKSAGPGRRVEKANNTGVSVNSFVSFVGNGGNILPFVLRHSLVIPILSLVIFFLRSALRVPRLIHV